MRYRNLILSLFDDGRSCLWTSCVGCVTDGELKPLVGGNVVVEGTTKVVLQI